MECLHCLKFLLKQNDLLYKIDYKETYFFSSPQQKLAKLSDLNGQATYTNVFPYVLNLS